MKRRVTPLYGFAFVIRCSLALCARSMPAQVAATPPYHFEAATVKLAPPATTNSNFNFDKGRLTIKNATLLAILKEAYELNRGSDDQIVGASAWTRETTFDIEAKEDDATADALNATPFDIQRKAVDEMLRELVEERFGLKAHFEQQPRTVAALAVSKGGSKLTPFTGCDPFTKGDSCPPTEWLGLRNDGHGHVQGKDASMDALTNMLARLPDIGGRMVVDTTGLKGRFNFDLHFAPDGMTSQNGDPSLFTALQEQLGLKLDTKKMPIPVLVIDSVDRPSPN
jgi:uncharacterized protein (TIGR03435 family)